MMMISGPAMAQASFQVSLLCSGEGSPKHSNSNNFKKALPCRGLYSAVISKSIINKEIIKRNSRARRILPLVETKPHTFPKCSSSLRIYVVSDLHTDYLENMKWVEAISTEFFIQDTLIVAGDVAEKLGTFEKTMALLKMRFRHVFFVPGNHDLWCRDITDKNMDSLGKLDKILELCYCLGVETKPKMINGVGIIPLYSWYHQSFDKEEDISGYQFPPLKLVCRDFQACKWSFSNMNSGETLACHFDNLNDGDFWKAVEDIKRNTQEIISFSHFLPRPELCPEKRMLFYPNLPKVVGSDFLEARVRMVHGAEGNPQAWHVFGHTHFCWDTTLDGVRYFQAPLAYPKERLRRMNGGGDWLPFCIYNSDTGGFVKDPLPFFWSNYYRENKRDPNNNRLAPWVDPLYKAL